jgi:hypothetical protein
MKTDKTIQPRQRPPARPQLAFSPHMLSLEHHLLQHLFKTKRKPSPEGMADLARTAAPAVKELWELLNASRPRKLPLYMEKPESAGAYLSGFFLPNVARIEGILDQREVAKCIADHLRPFVSAREELCIVDHGSGPLTATFALLFWLLNQFPELRDGQPLTVRVLAIEASHAVLTSGRQLMDAWSAGTPFDVRVEKKGTKELPGLHPHLILSANTLNELSTRAKDQLLEVLGPLIARGARALFIEPGQDQHAWELARFRNTLLDLNRAISVTAPCCHRLSCPLGPDSGRKDWCWFGHTWKPTPWMRALDKETGLRHTELNFSFVLFSPSRVTQTESIPWGRFVSDTIPVPTAKQSQTLRYVLENQWSGKRNNRIKSRGTDRHAAREERGAQAANAPQIEPQTKQLICAQTGELLALFSMNSPEEHRGRSHPTLSGRERGPTNRSHHEVRGGSLDSPPVADSSQRLCHERSAAHTPPKRRRMDTKRAPSEAQSKTDANGTKAQPKRAPANDTRGNSKNSAKPRGKAYAAKRPQR